MSNNIKILFWLLKHRTNKDGEAPLMLRVSYKSERKQLSTGFSIKENNWDSAKMKMKGSNEFAKQVNDYIRNSSNRIAEIYNEQFKKGDVYLIGLIDAFLGKDSNNMTLIAKSD